jgi:hypothetical protein
MTDRRGFDGRAAVLLLAAVVSLAGVWMLPPLPQDPAYHQFADRRELFGIPNFFNIATNLAFLLVGVAGIYLCLQRIVAMRASWLVFFSGVMLVCFGSGYYHFRPDNDTLVWDRLPMSVAFMGLFVAVVGEAASASSHITGRTSAASRASESARGPRLDPIGARVNPRLEAVLLAPAIFVGIASVLYWHYTDDLRFYAWVQFMPLLVIALAVLLFPVADGRTGHLAAALAIYLASKLAEYFDRAVFVLSDANLSGHSLKHLLAALAVYWIVRMLRAERAIT